MSALADIINARGADADLAMKAAEAADRTQGADLTTLKPGTIGERWHARELQRLRQIEHEATSDDLRAKIGELICLKERAFALGQEHTEATRSYGFGDERTSAAQAAWEAARKVAEGAAEDVSLLPFQRPSDALIRAEAFANGIDAAGDMDTKGAPEFEEDCLTLLESYRGALQDIAAREALSPEFKRCWQTFNDAERAYREADAEYTRLDNELKRIAPIPADLVIVPDAVWFRTEKMLLDATKVENRPLYPLTFAEAAAKLPVLQAFRPIFDAAEASINPQAAIDRIDAALDARARAATDLINCPTTSAQGLQIKLETYIAEWASDRIGDSPRNAETIRRKVTDQDAGVWGIARLYQDACRIVDAADPIAAIEPFDADGFIDRFTAIPGHEFDQAGRTIFQEPSAWPGLMEYSEYNALFTVSGDRLKAYLEAERREPGFVLNPLWTPEDEARQAAYNSVILPADRMHLAYPDDPAKAAMLRQVAARQADIRKSRPVGAHLWEALSDWEKVAVRTAAQRRAAEASL